MCGSRKIQRRLVVETALRGNRSVAVMADVCPVCGERFFDMAAMEKLERAGRRGARRRRRTD
jgi:YgiT-type zinc finger domain-containing protein